MATINLPSMLVVFFLLSKEIIIISTLIKISICNIISQSNKRVAVMESE